MDVTLKLGTRALGLVFISDSRGDDRKDCWLDSHRQRVGVIRVSGMHWLGV